MGDIKDDKGINPLVNNHFLLRVDAVYDLPCFRISGFSDEKEFENIQSGGVNDYVYLREKPISKPLTFQIERYIGTEFFDPLPVGKQLDIPIILYISRHSNEFTEARQTFTFIGCTVMNKQYGELDAEKSGLMVEKTTIAYRQVTLVQGSDQELKPSWKFDATGKLEGEGTRKAILNTNEVRKAAMLQKTRLWPAQRSARTITDISK